MKRLGGFNQHLVLNAGLLLVLLGVQPLLWGMVARAAGDVHAKRSQRAQIGDVERRTSEIKAVTEAQQEFLDQLDVVVPLEGSLPQVIERLEHLANERQLQLQIRDIQQQVDTNAAEQEVPVKPLRISLQATGVPSSLLNFLDAVEHVQEVTVIEQWSMLFANTVVASPVPGSVPSYTLTMNVLFFIRSERDGREE